MVPTEQKKLPIGIQTFSEIIEEHHAYVDKTGMAVDLVENGKYYFLSRPRRFGKSLLVSTLQALFEGRQELFTGLAAHDRWDWHIKYPVIKLSFAGVARTVDDMKQDVHNILRDNEERLELQCRDTADLGGCFKELIKKAFQKYDRKVVILVDEYDKLILDNLDQVEMAKEAREILKDLYTTIKDSDEFIKFAFLTGVSKFAKVSIFSGLNNLLDITLSEDFATICGYTHNDLETVFLPYLQNVDMEKVREWYNGYKFLGDKVYNPFDILLFIKNNFKFSNYWFATGTPTFLIKIIQRHNYFLPQLTDLWVNNSLIDSFDIENIKLEPILFQAGYLSIKEMRERKRGGYEYRLSVPNKEVQLSFNDVLIDYLTDQTTSKGRYQDQLYTLFEEGNLDALRETLTSLFASIPYNNYVNNTISSYEGYFASVIYAYLASLGLDITAEDVTSKGRIDLTIKFGNNIYILEFKVDGSGNALEQIKEKNYQQKYLAEEKTIYLIGIDFNSAEKNISQITWEQI
ncbi:MAG: ATP-binding protein [Thermodesulfobacteriota bacterium]|nr:ATP-binding protein [Thermodesulfobacteriota bacterium]